MSNYTALIDSYRTGKATFTYALLMDHLCQKAAQGYRIIPLESVGKDIQYSTEIVKCLCKCYDLILEPYWDTIGIRLVPEDEPNRED